MFWKKTCKECGKKLEKDFSYCPYCGFPLRDKEKDYGFLGKDDLNFLNNKNKAKLPFGFNFLFKNLMKEMDKQFKELDKQTGEERATRKTREKENLPSLHQKGISINISSGAGTPIIKVKSFGNIPEFKEMEKQIEKPDKKRKIEMNEEKTKKLAKLPRQEAESKVRRLSGKVIYEIELPGVKSIKDIIINELENSIEIKAFTKDKAYFKFLPVSLPLLKYGLLKGKLVLELGEK